jgi:hypothetical protein
VRLLGKEPDEVVAAKVGKSAGAVRSKRTTLGIPTALERRTRAARKWGRGKKDTVVSRRKP